MKLTPAVLAIIVIVIAAGVTRPGYTQSPEDLRAVLRELEAIRKSQAAMQREIAELKTLIQKPQPAAVAPARVAAAIGATVSLAGTPAKGRADAPVTVVEFSDFQCPFCARHVRDTIPLLDREYIETGKVRYVYRNLPIESIHPNAFKAAEAAACANEGGRFWPLHARFFANQRTLAPAQLGGHAAAVGLDAAAFGQCLSSGRFTTKVRKDISDGSALGISGTPAFLIGRTVPGNTTLKVDAYLYGAKPFASFKHEIDKLLK
jgi:protein-disulfide isomerase